MPSILHSFLWKYLERSGSQAVQFVISIVLARLLAPEDFGLIALVLVFIAIASVFVQSGLKTALVQKKEASNLDFSTVFWLSLLLAFTMYMALFLCAPLIANFYGNENLILVVRVLGLTLLFGALSSIQEAYIQKHFLFKKLFFRSLAVIIPSGILGISLAYLGFGIWALVWQQLASTFLMCVFMLFMVPWKPAFEFSVASAKKLFNFGYKLLLSSLLDTIYNNLMNLLIGKFFSPATLGFYNRGEQFPKVIVANVNESINAVLFPALANVQDDIGQLKHKMRKCIKCSCFAIFPLMALLASSATPTVEFVLGEKWLPCVVFLQISCFIFALWPLHTTNLTAINSLGRSDIFLKLEIIKKMYGISAITIALYFFGTPLALVLSQAIISPIGVLINSFPNKKLLNYGFLEQAKDILPSFVFSLAVGFAVFPLSLLGIPNFAAIISQVALGFAIYLLLAKIFRMESLDYFLEILKRGIK
jgi:O-antigen/teichoic acid export membrane protein